MKMIKLALIGCGKWGKNYLKTLTSMEGCELKWVCDLDPRRLEEASSAFSQIRCTENKEDILNDSTVQGVIIATTPESHYILAKEFINKGKAVLVEKPVTIRLKDSIELINLAAAQNTMLMAGYTLIYHPAVKRIKDFLRENDYIDNLCYLNMSRTNALQQVCGVDVLYDLAVHDIYISRYLVGEDPVWVIAQGGSYPESANRNVIYILLGFPDGKIASIFASFIHSEKTRKIALITSKEKLVFDDVQPEGKKVQLFTNGDYSYVLSVEGDSEPLEIECRHFIECISENRAPKSGKDYICFVEKVTDCIRQSLAKGGEKIMIHG
jgi:predicted dehydrogenase